MKKLTKGAFSMVLAGAVTFSVTNALLVDPSANRVAEENSVTISKGPKKTDVTKEETVKDPTPTTTVKEEQNKLPLTNAATNVALNSKNESDRTMADIQLNTKGPATNSANASAAKVTTPAPATQTAAAATPPATSAQTPPTSTPVTKPTPTETHPSSAAATTTNNGQEVAQAAKEKADSRRDAKENSGKNM